MPVTCEEYNKVCVMTVTGDFAGAEVAPIRTTFQEKLDVAQIVDFVVDMENSGFIDSEGLELLLEMKRKCEELFGQVKLSGLDDNVRKIMEITRLEPKFECQSDLTTALKTMR